MSKARTLANLISDNAELADGQISVAEVVGAAPTANPTFTGTASGTFSGPLTGNVTGNVTGNLTGDVTGAVTGDVTAPEIDLAAIAATKSDTAVDVFVYDTRKDSDGGAWRKRTQHTSWYNETLNTSTRGSRKEFPAVAVIVSTNDDVTIYDGDDPDLPMWMVFNTSGATEWQLPSLLCGGSTVVKGISALNGAIVSASSTYGYRYLNFVSERSEFRELGYYRVINRPIVDRNATSSTEPLPDLGSSGWLIADTCNDVAMTVLPNAPIDSATGLPVPTIAVATHGGVSVIKDDGTVISKATNSAATNGVAITKEGRIVALAPEYYGYWNDLVSETSGYVSSHSDSSYYFGSTNGTAFNYPQPLSANPNNLVVSELDTITTGCSKGVTVHELSHGGTDDNTGINAHITSSYNTGWMNGDIKLATLSDTDDTDVTGAELVTNGTFGSDSSWTKENGWSIGSGVATYATGTGRELIQTGISTTVGTQYVVTFDITSVSSGGFGTYSLESEEGGVDAFYSQTGTYSRTLTATSTSLTLRIRSSATSASGSIDNVSVRLAEEDRSVNGNGLQVFGTITKDPVASGADLVAYSGFSGSSFLRQPYNSDLDLGTDDIAVTFWFKSPSGGGYLYERMDPARSGNRLRGFLNNSNVQFFVGSGTGINASATLTDNTWHHYCGVIRSGQMFLYIDSKEIGNISASSTSITNTAATLTLGSRSDNGSSFSTGSLALFRISATAPSPEQIKKIYEDEKVLFQENAQATLYAASPASGSPDAVTALAYDDSTELLHVGTDNGRSVFQGLRRVDNTTDAVGAAISASNGLVAED